jgi:tetratricopeptide (TPR) repeat protein
MALEMGKEEMATDTLKALSLKYPDNLQIKVTKILSLLKQKKYQEALDLIEKEDMPNQVKNQLKGSIFAEQKQYKEAIPLFEEIVKDENYLGSSIDLSKLYLATQQLDKATSTIKSAVDKGLKTQQAYIQMARCYLLQKKYKEALPLINEAKISYSDSWELKLLEGWNLYYLQLHKEASKVIGELSAPESGEKSKLLLRGLTSYSLGDADESQSHLESYLKKYQDKSQDYFLASWNLSNIYFRKAQYENAILLLNKILSFHPNENPAISLKFKALLLSKKDDEALVFLNNTKNKRDDLQFSLDHSFYFEQKKNYSKAMQALSTSLKELPALYQWTRLGLISDKNFNIPNDLLAKEMTGRNWGRLGVIASSQGNWRAADQCFEKANQKLPSNPIILNNWAWTLLELESKDKEKVLNLCKEANQLLPNNADILDTYFNALFLFKEYEKIVTLSQDHLVLFADNSKILYIIGKAHELRNKTKDAIRYYESALGLQKDHWLLPITKPQLEEKIKTLKEL